ADKLIPTKTIPRGFSNVEQFDQCAVELKQALSKSGLDVTSIQVRGSSATGVSSKGGGFRFDGSNPSDIDFAIEFNQKLPGISTSKNIDGFIHPNKLFNNFPELQAWADKWSTTLGRKVTPGGFQPGKLPSDPANVIVK
ncbi:hypothetical protein, partial [Acetonema longum]